MTIEEILATYHTIAVVGLTSNAAKPSHYVSAYMRDQGYRIIPVNPDEDEVFGLKAYPDLASPRGADFVPVEIVLSAGRSAKVKRQIVADAFQRMVLRNTTPEEAYQEVVTKYNESIAKTP